MGRQIRPLRVHQIASRMLDSGRLKSEPLWYRVVGALPPSTTRVRPQPVQLVDTLSSRSKNARKTSNQFRPQKIVYEEDALRERFFRDHPWELARPRVVVEDMGLDGQVEGRRWDWSTGIMQPGKAVNGESVVQRQLWLIHNRPDLTVTEAYNIARKEFYQIRLQQDIERRIAVEEARHVGAVFDKSYIDIMFEREGKVLQEWRVKAAQDLALRKHKRNAAYSSTSLDEDLANAAAAAGNAGGETEEGGVPGLTVAGAL